MAMSAIGLSILLLLVTVNSRHSGHRYDHSHHDDLEHEDEHGIGLGFLKDDVVDTDDNNASKTVAKAQANSQIGEELHAFSGNDKNGNVPGIGGVPVLGAFGKVNAMATTSWVTSGTNTSSTTTSSHTNTGSLTHDDAIGKATVDGRADSHLYDNSVSHHHY